MRKNRLVTAIGVTLLLSVAPLAACGGGNNDNNQTNNQTTTNNQTNNQTTTCEDFEEIGGPQPAGTVLDGCYTVIETLGVSEGDLQIEPGTVLEFNEETGLRVEGDGVLIAEGTDESVIVMRGSTDLAGHWQGIGVTSKQPSNLLSHVSISSAGSGTWDPCCPVSTSQAGINVWEEGILTVQNVTSTDNEGYGVAASDTAELRDFQNNTFAGNSEAAVFLRTNMIGDLDAGSDYGDGEVVVGEQNVSESATWKNINATYRMFGLPEIGDEVLVTIEAGSEFIFEEDAGIRVLSGTLRAEGTDEAPIFMRGATETPGFWRGISIQSKQPDNLLEHVAISHGGSGNWDPCCPEESRPGNLNVFDDSIASIRNVTLSDSSGYGLNVAADSELQEFGNNSFSANETASIWITANNLGALDALSTYGEGAVHVRGNSVDSDATWKVIDTVYDVREDSVIEIVGGAEVTVDAGASFEFRENAGLRVTEGVLQAVGTDSARISFTGTTETAGWWKGIAVTSPNTANEISYADIGHGGSTVWDPCCPEESENANVNVFDNGYLTLTNCTLFDADFGTWVNPGDGGTLNASDNTYDNAPVGMP